MTDKQINKWLRRRFSQVGWVLLAYYGILTILASLAIILDSAGQMIQAFAVGDYSMNLDYDAIYGNAWGYLLTIFVGVSILHAWKGSDYWKTELFAKKDRMTPGVFFCLLSLLAGSQMFNSIWVTILEWILNQFDLSALAVLESVSGSSDTLSMFLYASIFAPIAEELLFRGYILRSLQPYGKRFAILGSAVLFGLFHGNLLQTPYAFLVGLVLGYVTVEYSVVWAIALHMFNNLVLADLLTRLTANLSDVVYGAVNLLIFGGFAVASVVILIVRRRAISAYNCSEWMDRRCLKWFFINPGILVFTVLMVLNMITLLFA